MADIVIFDTPPTAMLVDAVYLVRYIETALYVVRCEYARTQYILNLSAAAMMCMWSG